jgi:AraC-like DNA-binding protein
VSVTSILPLRNPTVVPGVPPSPLASLLLSRATADGLTLSDFPGLCFWRASRPTRIRKMVMLGPRLVVVAQGRKVATFRGGNRVYDEDHLLVVTGETEIDGLILEATPERPYLAVCMELPPELVARTLLAIGDGASARPAPAHPASTSVPAFVSPLTEPVTNALARLLRALDEPLERKVVAPLVQEELVFRLMRTDAAAVLRAAVRDGDAAIPMAMRYIRDHAASPLTVESVARHVGMSASHFAHRFTAVARVSPMRFVKHVRLETARTLMLAERVRVQEAATRVGYESASHFTRDFKIAYGAAPAEYVRRILDGA